MRTVFENLIQKYFKVFFALALIGFVLMIFLMNLPRLLAAGKEDIGERAFQPRSSSSRSSYQPAQYLPTQFYQWHFTKPSSTSHEEGFIEFRGSKMALTVRF